MRIQRIIAAAIRCAADQVERSNTVVAGVIAYAFHLRHGQLYLGMPSMGGKPFLGSLERCQREWSGTRGRSLRLAIASA